jgi:hypothetical protein
MKPVAPVTKIRIVVSPYSFTDLELSHHQPRAVNE